jgi:glucosamine-6-phosphate deaminase
MIPPESRPIMEFTVDSLRVVVHEDRARMGRAAAEEVARAIAERLAIAAQTNIVFAAAPSQNEFLAALIAYQGIDWSRVVGFHMDEYLGLGPDHRASFRRYLREHLFQLAGLTEDRLRLIPGEDAERPLRTALEYEQKLIDEPVDIVCGGIGENGHLAFNDPPVADFLDPVLVKVVRLDAACRIQQLNDECFDSLDDVPTHAYTLTVPALMAAKFVSIVAPGPRKVEAVLATIRGPIGESCPSTALRNHSGYVLHLDRESARLL